MAHAWAVAFSVGRRNWFMASIERTVYPRFTRAPSVKELREIYTPTPTDVAFVATTARGPAQKFALMILLKVYQRLHYFPDPQSIPGAVISHIRAVLKLPDDLVPDISPATLYRYYGALREHLELESQGKHVRHVAAQAMQTAAQTMENPADLINAAIETLLVEHCELPAFSTLDRMATFLEGHAFSARSAEFVPLRPAGLLRSQAVYSSDLPDSSSDCLYPR